MWLEQQIEKKNAHQYSNLIVVSIDMCTTWRTDNLEGPEYMALY